MKHSPPTFEPLKAEWDRSEIALYTLGMLRASIPFIATAIAFGMLGIFLVPATPTIGMLLCCVAGLLVTVGIVGGVKEWRRQSDPYSLEKLREIHLYGDDIPVEEEIEEFDSILCPHCSTVYDAHLPVCPHCHRAVYTSGLG